MRGMRRRGYVKRNLMSLLMLLATLSLCAQSSPSEESYPMINPPAEMLHFLILGDGRAAIYFVEDEWIELSRLMWEDREATAKEAVKEAVVPILAENQVLKAQAGKDRLYKVGFWAALGAALAASVWALTK